MTACILWDKALDKDGYPLGKRDGKMRRWTRVVYEEVVGPIPEGLVVDHLCRVRACINPDHLEAVTVRENTIRGIGPSAVNARRTVCKNGHPFTPKNTGVQPSGRKCVECARLATRRWRKRKANTSPRRST